MLPLFLSLLVLLCGGTDLYAKPPSGDAAQQELVEITALLPDAQPGSISAYTVPTGKRLVITDVQISGVESTSTGHDGCPRAIQRAANGMEAFTIWRSFFSKQYVAGIEFKENETVFVRSQCNGSTFFELRGFLTDIN